MGKWLKGFFRDWRPTQKIYAKISNIKWKHICNKKKKALHKSGIKTVFDIQNILSNYKIPFFFDMGTLLGIIREGELLSHDMDIDVAIYIPLEEIDKFRKYMCDNDCKLAYSYVADRVGNVEDSFLKNGIKFDVNYYRKDGEQDICYLLYRDAERQYADDNILDVVKLRCPSIKSILLYDFKGKKVNVPENPEQYLETRYGKWRVPDKNYVYWKGNSAEQIDLQGKRIILV